MTNATEPRSERGRRMRQLDVPDVLSQIRVQGGGPNIELTGAYAYYINPNGATIRDALILYPNGGIPELDDPNLRSRYGENAELYRARQARKGLEYVGPTLTEGGARRLVEVLEANRPDEILFIEDEIAEARKTAEEADIPAYRDQAKRRLRQLTKRLEILTQPLDADALEAELKEIARGQQMAKVDPAVLRVMRQMIGDAIGQVDSRIVAHFAQGKAPSGDGGGVKLTRGSGGSKGAEFEGRARIDD